MQSRGEFLLHSISIIVTHPNSPKLVTLLRSNAVEFGAIVGQYANDLSRIGMSHLHGYNTTTSDSMSEWSFDLLEM